MPGSGTVSKRQLSDCVPMAAATSEEYTRRTRCVPLTARFRAEPQCDPRAREARGKRGAATTRHRLPHNHNSRNRHRPPSSLSQKSREQPRRKGLRTRANRACTCANAAAPGTTCPSRTARSRTRNTIRYGKDRHPEQHQLEQMAQAGQLPACTPDRPAADQHQRQDSPDRSGRSRRSGHALLPPHAQSVTVSPS